MHPPQLPIPDPVAILLTRHLTLRTCANVPAAGLASIFGVRYLHPSHTLLSPSEAKSSCTISYSAWFSFYDLLGQELHTREFPSPKMDPGSPKETELHTMTHRHTQALRVGHGVIINLRVLKKGTMYVHYGKNKIVNQCTKSKSSSAKIVAHRPTLAFKKA
jgi:hypothetical protein